jgi:hypothetical protein
MTAVGETDLRDWARETAPMLTDEDWETHKMWAAAGFPVDWAWLVYSEAQTRALLVRRDEVVLGLSDDQGGELLTIMDGDGFCSLVDVAELLHRELVTDVVTGFEYKTTSFGRAVIHKLESKR